MGAAGGLECAIAFGGEHGEPFASVVGVNFTANQPVSFESGYEMGRTGRAEQHPLREVRHAEPLIGRVEQRDQDVELGDGHAVRAAQLGVEVLQYRAVQHHQRAPRLPLFRIEELVWGA